MGQMKKKTSLHGGPIKCAFQGQCRNLWYTLLASSWLPRPTNAFPAASTLEAVLKPVLTKEGWPDRQLKDHRAIQYQRSILCAE